MSARHIFGLVIFAALAAALYWFWEEGLVMVQRELRPWPQLRTAWGEFGLMIVLAAALLVLSGVQWLWDKLPGGGHADD